MKPIKLKIKGLNSFIEEQVIDFERLTDRGLFGIFGPTGSGKSTILDGITLALYGDVSRKSSNFINTNCDRLNISFEFQISGSVPKRYLIDREFKRKKDIGTPQSGKCKIVDITEDTAIILSDKVTGVNETVKSIVGLSLEDFTRTVVLPQGRFSEFLKLEGKDRRNMLERLFNLQKYGDNLSLKLIREINKVKTNNSVLLGQLIGYEDVSEAVLVEKSNILNKALEAILKVKKELEIIEKSYKEKELIWNLQLELDYYKTKEETLKIQEVEIEKQKVKLNLSETASKILPYIKSYEETLSDLDNCEIELAKVTKEIVLLASEKNSIEIQWKDAVEAKDTRLPNLIIKKQKTEDAIEEKNVLDLIKNNIEVLQGRIKKGEVMDKDGDIKFKSLSLEIDKSAEKLKENEKLYEELKVDEELKDNVQKGLIESERRDNYIALLDRNSDKIKEIRGNIKVEEKNKLELESKFKLKDKEYKLKVKELEDLVIPGEQKDLLKLQEDLSKSKEAWSAFNRLSAEINISEDSVNELKILLNKDKEEISKVEESANKLKKLLKDIERENISYILRKELKDGSLCPVCGSKEHNIDNIKVMDTVNIESLESDINTAEKKLKSLNSNITSSETKIKTLNETIILKEEAIKSLGIGFKNTTPESIEEKFNYLKILMEKYLNDKDILDQTINVLNSEINMVNIGISNNDLIIKNYNNQFMTFELETKENNQKLKESEGYLNRLMSGTSITNFKAKNNEIKEIEKKKVELDKIIKMLRENIDILLKEKEEIQVLNQRVKDTLNKCYTELEVLNRNREEKEISIKSKIGEVDNLSELLENLKNEIIKIEVIYKAMEEKKISLEKAYTDKNNKIISIKTKSDELNKRKSLEKSHLDEWIKNTGFNSVEEAKLNTLKEEEIILLKRDIDTYFETVNKIKGAIESLLKRINGKALSEELWEEVKSLKISKEEEYKLINEEKVKVEEEVKIIKTKLKELSNLLDKKKDIDHELALLGDLEKLFKGKKFVEFVAANQLKYVSIEASKRLKEISSGSYGLEVDDFGKFIIRDYKNGGAERDASTLSGGETFLASLALALALSAQIQLKGTAPLELFFLDEGFGTLDDNLLEVVMNSLERIHNDKLKVGIISHVESIKNRVPVKLILAPAESGRGGSKVKIERS